MDGNRKVELVLIPRELTPAMLDAYYGGTGVDAGDVDGVNIHAAWAAIIAAAEKELKERIVKRIVK